MSFGSLYGAGVYQGYLLVSSCQFPGYDEGYDPCSAVDPGGDPEGPEGPELKVNVRDLFDSGGRLGCGVPQFFLTGRCASSGVLCVLDGNVVSAQWDRRLDDISEAVVTLSFSGDATYTCCECLAEAEPWCHELHIWRDGEEVWVGPIQEIEYEYDQVTIIAKDSLAWLDVRIPEVDIDFSTVATELTDIGVFVIQTAFAEDSPTYTCEFDSLFTADTGMITRRFFERYNQTALDILFELVDTGLDVTVLGRTIVLTGDENPLVPLIILNDEHIMGGLTIRKDGKLQGNRYFVHFDEDGGDPAVKEAAEFYCSGPIERIRDGDGLPDLTSAQAVAEIYVQAAALAPRIIEMRQGTKLSPDTPWTLGQMIPGARVDVAVTKLCLNLTQSFRLTMVEVQYDAENGESVMISLNPINNVAVA